MEFKDYYDILGVSRDADQKAIQKAFRQLARQYHPDTDPGNKKIAEKFKEINEAYEVLKDPDKRAKYDQFGREWQNYQQGGGGFDWTSWAQATGEGPTRSRYTRVDNLEDLFGGSGGFSDFFETLFGMGGSTPGSRTTYRATQRTQRGRNIEHPLTITLAEAYHGTIRTLSKDGRQLQVKIPPGAKTGSKVRIPGEGEPGFGGGQTDLYLIINVMPDQQFERKDDDLFTEFELSLYTALLGGTVSVPTLDGDVTLTIPPETQNGSRFRLRGKGMPRPRQSDTYGDLYATTSIQIPTNLSKKERELIHELQKMRPSD